MKNLYIGKSNIQGWGLFSADNLKKGAIIGISHVIYDRVWYQVHPIGIFYNHSNIPNCIVKMEDNVNLVIANTYINTKKLMNYYCFLI